MPEPTIEDAERPAPLAEGFVPPEGICEAMAQLGDERITLMGLLFEASTKLGRILSDELEAEAGIPLSWFELMLRLGPASAVCSAGVRGSSRCWSTPRRCSAVASWSLAVPASVNETKTARRSEAQSRRST